MNDSFSFFLSRSFELLHRKTFDTYRVSLHNPYTIFDELEKSIEKFNKGRIKHFDPTIALIGEEAKSYIDNPFLDSIFSFGSFSKKIIKDSLENNCIKNKDGKRNRTLSLLCKTVCHENRNFKIKLLENIKVLLNNNSTDYERLDTYTSWLISQLLFEGFSRKFVVARIRKCEWDSIDHTFDILEKWFSKEDSEYDVIFKIRRNDAESIKAASVQIAEIESFPRAFVKNRYINDRFKEKSEGEIFISVKTNGRDFWSALKKAHQIISETIEINILHDSEIKINLENQALVIHCESQKIRMESIHEPLDGFYNYKESEFDRFISNFKRLEENSVAREKIRSAIRFYKLGNDSLDIEHKILNYWIGFEQLFASVDSNEDSIQRIKAFFISINAVFYWQLRTNYLLQSLERVGKTIRIEDITPRYSLGPDELPPLMQTRFSNYITWLNDPRFLRSSLEQHIKRIDQHLTRIYRVRNELVHEGRSSVDLFLLAGHLRHYLIFSIEQITNGLIENYTLNHLDDVFVFFENLLTVIKNAGNIQEIFRIKPYNGYME